jgi:hypothetical protein
MSEEVLEGQIEEVSDVEIEEFEPTLDYARQLEDGEWEPTPEYAAQLQASDRLADPAYWAQEKVGDRKVLSVDGDIIELDGATAKIGGDLKDALLKAGRQFGPYKVAVDVYREKKAMCFAISQGLLWKGANITRHVPQIRLNAAAELFGYLFNYGGEGRVQLLKTAKSEGEKKALENAVFFHGNRGYETP